MAENNEIREKSVVIGRTFGVLVLLIGILLAAHLCAAGSPGSNPIPSIFEPHSTPAESIYHLSLFVLGITSLIFLVVFSLLLYLVVKFRGRAADEGREPAQVYGSNQIEMAWTVIPVLIVFVLFLATARVIHAVQEAPSPRRGGGHRNRTSVVVGVPISALGIVTANELHVPVSDPAQPTPAFLETGVGRHRSQLLGSATGRENRLDSESRKRDVGGPARNGHLFWPVRAILWHAAREDVDAGVGGQPRGF